MNTTQDAAAEPVPEAPARCANCGAALQGPWCHACGQSVANPVRQLRHALGEILDSFLNLDGRTFHTLLDLPFPGRVANRYLGGHRVGYVAPLRLFVVLAVLTFVFAQLAAQVAMRDGKGINIGNGFGRAETPEEVEKIRTESLAGIEAGMAQIGEGNPGWKAMASAINTVNAQADQRLAELRGEQSGGAGEGAAPPPASAPIQVDISREPIHLGWLPGFANRWLTVKAAQMQANVPRIQQDPQLLVRAFLSAVPRALFVLVPLFALLLALAHLGSGRLYLEHLVVALYSHAWICLTVLVVSLLSMLGAWLAPFAGWAGRLTGLVSTLLFLALPIYLLAMHKLVYRQSWLSTVLKYIALGTVYTFVVSLAALVLILLSFATA